MSQLPLCTKKTALVSYIQAQKNSERGTKIIFDSGRMRLVRQARTISLLLLIFSLLFIFLPGHVIAKTSIITGCQPFQDRPTSCNLRNAIPSSSLYGPLFVKSVTRVHLGSFTSIPASIDSSNREES